ncbi:MAG: tRNA (adenosine(37)-N6)-dimethylallyltransferase MiaA [Clostridia bacterium]|nr:tRNA (adenosine(37)-N6)-dimethylallyltransferase MiaA [Clostridia bacterium]
MNFKNKVIALVGPTGVGKTETSLALAELTNSEIISCDSMQIYRGMDIGTAKATKEEMLKVKHHLIDIKDPTQSYSVCEYVADAKNALEEIFKKGKNVMVVGGTGLYADSFIRDTNFAEASADNSIRQELEAFAKENGNEALHNILRNIDPESAQAIHPNNTKRVIRAIEYFRKSGEKISDHNKESALVPSPYDHIYIGLTRNRDNLYERIDQRVDQMICEGLADEVFNLWKKGCNLKMTSMQALGYKEIIYYIQGKCTFDEAIRILKRDSRRYAKRQLTWFNRNKNVNWINLSDYNSQDDVIKDITDIIYKKFGREEVPG